MADVVLLALTNSSSSESIFQASSSHVGFDRDDEEEALTELDMLFLCAFNTAVTEITTARSDVRVQQTL
jgi:hypothetical protein